jgi:predicted RNA-binding Zn-ribbon protein involved in translation (DUF1610 family)
MTDTTTSKPTAGEAFPCPECGETDAWWADYYEAVAQSVALVTDDEGEPELADYTGATKSYSDGATSDESYRCGNCGHVIELGTHVYVPAGTPPFADIAGMLSNARTALDDPASLPEPDAAQLLQAERRATADDPTTAYVIDQLDRAINALRPIYEVTAES